ncbi:MAG: hypothetical protein LBF44_03615 [Holosporaceae bacterium]|jgi:hypothetical protein|nr:hypothetical protein [Holosporaceae bacterium]
MKKIFTFILLAFFTCLKSTALEKNAAIYQIHAKKQRLGALLVIDIKQIKPTRIFMFNGWLTSDLEHFVKSLPLGDGSVISAIDPRTTDFQDSIRTLFGPDCTYSNYTVNTHRRTSCIDFENGINIMEILSCFPKADQFEKRLSMPLITIEKRNQASNYWRKLMTTPPSATLVLERQQLIRAKMPRSKSCNSKKTRENCLQR